MDYINNLTVKYRMMYMKWNRINIIIIIIIIQHGTFQTKFLGILYHKLSTIMLIRRSAGPYKCHF